MMRNSIVLGGIFIGLFMCGYCDGAWQGPVLLSGLNDGANVAIQPNLSSDKQTLYFARKVGGVRLLFEAKREGASWQFTNERSLDELGTDRNLGTPWVSSDGLRLYHTRYDGVSPSYRLRMAYRDSVNDLWTRSLGSLPGTIFFDIDADGYNETCPSLTGDELTMFFRSNRTGSEAIWRATRGSVIDGAGNYVEFSNESIVSELVVDGPAWFPCVLPNGLTMYFSAKRDGRATYDLYKATRGTTGDVFGDIQMLDISTDGHDELGVYVSGDENVLTFYDDRGTWMAVPEPGSLLLISLGVIFMRKKG